MLLLEILTHGKHNKPYAVATYIHVNGAICLGNCFGFQKERNRNDFSWQNFFENKIPIWNIIILVIRYIVTIYKIKFLENYKIFQNINKWVMRIARIIKRI